MRYPAVIDGKKGAYGVTFPDLPGIVAMGKTLDEALVNAEEASLAVGFGSFILHTGPYVPLIL